jgi:cytochrome d ubiquinol oxidase subunit II
LWRGADARRHLTPYLLSVCLFAIGYIGLAISLWPYIVPFTMTPAESAAAENAQALLLAGALPLLALVLGYTGYVYWLFRAKVDDEAAYH